MRELQKDLEIMPVEYTTLEMTQLEAEVKNSEIMLHDILDNVVLEGSLDALRLHVSEAKEILEKGMPKLDPKDQIHCNSFDDGALDSIVSDYSLSNKLAEQIVDSLRIASDNDSFSTELAKLKVERTEVVELRGKVYSLYLEQFIILLEKAIASKRKPIQIHSYEKVDNIHRHIPMLPLQSFICPITKDSMRDAV
ncbi:hypothetical protein SUGI_1146660 [Cryptomeria japonica]|nr:hypothetical protein SUGI_1146660 [Cryptomeria japonica]